MRAMLLAVLVPLLLAAAAPPEPAFLVQLSSGSLRGAFHETMAVFKGIPYAAPPVGELRWREPQPLAPWPGVRDATRPGSACVQNPKGLASFLSPLAAAYGAQYQSDPVASSEDCLYLNVRVPQWPPQRGLPVMVWLHGGSNLLGSGSQSAYDGASLVAHGVILVTVNYRLGVMGFFSHPELTAASPHHSSGNYALLDQLAALEWVRNNIRQFGGDPGNVTLFGESAGAIDVGMLLASPLSTGLFERAISESGPPFGLGSPPNLAQAEAVGAAVGSLATLRKLPATDVVRLANHPNSAVIDGWVLPRAPAAAYAAGMIQKVDVMVGLNGRELSAFRVASAAQAKPSGGAVDGIKKLADTARPLYGGWTDTAVALYAGRALFHSDEAIDQASNDMLMACPLGAVAALTTASGQRAFLYRFDRSIPGKGEAELGAFHSLELPFVFGAFADPAWSWLPFTDVDRSLSGIVETYWTNFARSGDPNSPGLPRWSAWVDGDEPYLEFDKNGKAVPQRSFSPPFCRLAPQPLKQRLRGN